MLAIGRILQKPKPIVSGSTDCRARHGKRLERLLGPSEFVEELSSAWMFRNYSAGKVRDDMVEMAIPRSILAVARIRSVPK